MRLFDTHAHLDDEQLTPIRDALLQSATETGVVGINSIGTDLKSSLRCVELAEQYDRVYASVGVHPNYCQDATDQDWQQIVKLAKHPAVVAIGETGLDRYRDYAPIELQKEWFKRHIELSYATGKPLVIHVRDCEPDILEVLAENRQSDKVLGILHSFAGAWETAQQCLEWGMYISFSGIVTYKKAENLRAISLKVPDDRILIETDSPYLSPHPVRGQRPNHPALVKHTAQCLAEVRGMTVEQFSELTTRNAEQLLLKLG